MNYYNTISPYYIDRLRRDFNRYKVKIELLTADEAVIGEVIADLSITAQGQITINRQQLTRRSCSLTLINVGGRYNPNRNRWFWINRKFKLWIGMMTEGYTDATAKQNTADIYWFSQGVYYATSVKGDTHTISIEGIDKGGALDGTLKLNMLGEKTIVKQGSKLSSLFRETLLLSDGISVIDPTPPLIDSYFDSVIIQQDIELNDNQYIGELFSQVAESYGANVYYDRDGRLRVERSMTENGFSLYSLKGIAYRFSTNDAEYEEATIDYGYECKNTVTVYTNINAKDNTGKDIENVSYTAYNQSPLSPINIKEIGIRRMDAIEAKYIDGLTAKEMTDRCRQTANYYLLNESLIMLTENFNSFIIPHIDVDEVILINDPYKDIDNEKFVVQSVSIPLSAGAMSIEATNLNYLPGDIDIEKEMI